MEHNIISVSHGILEHMRNRRDVAAKVAEVEAENERYRIQGAAAVNIAGCAAGEYFATVSRINADMYADIATTMGENIRTTSEVLGDFNALTRDIGERDGEAVAQADYTIN